MNIDNLKNTKINLSKIEEVQKLDNNPIFDRMKNDIEEFKCINEQFQKKQATIPYFQFKKNMYSCLENLLLQVIYIKDKKLRGQKMETIYNWYQNKKNSFDSINPIDTRTDKNFYEVYPIINQEKSNYYEARNYPLEFERANRTEEMGILPPKDR